MRRLVLSTLVAGAAAALLSRFALAYFAFPSADDYCIFMQTRDAGFWYMQVQMYLTWTGRYAAVFLESIVVQFDLIGGYRWFSFATLAANVLAFCMLSGAVCGPGADRRTTWVLGAVAAAVFIVGLPSLVEALYWMPGQASYQWGTITYVAWLALMIRSASDAGTARTSGWRRASIVALAILAPGYNEVMAPILFATMIAFLVWNRHRAFESERFLLAMFGLMVALTAVSFLAPGNLNRSTVYPDIPSRHNLGYALVETAHQTVRFLARFGLSPALWVGSLAAWWWGESRLPQQIRPAGRPVFSVAILLGLFGVAYLTLFPVYWEYGEVNYSGEGRTYNVTYVVACAIVVWIAGWIVSNARERLETAGLPSTSLRPGKTHRYEGAATIVAVVLALLLVAAPSTLGVFDALRTAPAYLKAEQARAAVLRSSPRTGTVFVDAMTVKPSGLFWGDIQSDSGHWINTCVANYFGLQAVRTRM